MFLKLGAGTLLECLRMDKKIIAVSNSSLMDNHQDDLQLALSASKYIIGSNLRSAQAILSILDGF